MAVCGLPSMLCVSPIQPDMDSCPGQSSGVTRNHLKFWESGAGPRASSCLSSTMVDRNDPDDSGSSQPPTPTRTRSESKPQMVIRDSALPGHELELSMSLNDAQRTTPSRSKSVKDEFDFTSTSTVARDDTFGRSRGLEEEASISGPPRKRARMSPLGFRVEESQAENVREQQQRYPLASTGSGVTGVHSLMQSVSVPSVRSMEREPSPSPSRGASSGSKPTTSWWLGPSPKNSAVINDLQHGFQSSVQEQPRANFPIGRGMIPGTSLQEKDFPFKEPSYYPNMLSSMETAEQVRRAEEAILSGGGRPKEQGRPYIAAAFQDPPEHSFFSRKETSTSRVSSTSTVSEETVPRPSGPFFGKTREATFQQDPNTLYGQQNQQQQHPFEVQGGRRRYTSTGSESQRVDLEREPNQGSFVRPQHVEQQRASLQGDQRSLTGTPGGNANTTFYARIRDAAQQPASGPFSEGGGYPGAINTSLGFNLAGPPRPSSQSGPGLVQFSGEATHSNLAQHQANSEALRNLLATHPSLGSIPSYAPQQVPNPDSVRLSFPNLSSLDFLQSLQQPRQSYQPQAADRHRQSAPPGHMAGSHPPPQGFSFLGAPPSSQHSLPAELNPPSLPPRSRQPGNSQASAGLRDFLSPQAPKGPSPLGLARAPAAGLHEIPTHLSLQSPEPPSLTVVMEGRSIGRRISLNDYDGYDRFAAAMRTMFDSHGSSQERPLDDGSCTLVNAIPGYVIAYEDEEGDVLLAGDLPWRDFVRMARRIRIVPSAKISFKLPTGPPRL